MTKNLMFAVALLSLALAGGCAKGGNGTGSGVTVSVSDAGNLTVFYVTQVEQFTAAVTGTNNTAVTWTLTQGGTDCTNNPTLCGSIDSTVNYTAPSTAPATPKITVTATSQADTTKSDFLTISVLAISVQLTPSPVNVGAGLTQQFTAVAIPDDAPQNFTWSIASCASACGTIDANGLYTAPPSVPSGKFTVQATSTLDPADGVANAKVTVLSSRLPSGTYAFRSSGFDATGATAVVGSLMSGGNGTIQSGVVDQWTTAGPVSWNNTAGTYTLNSNNQGTLTLTASGSISHTYTLVLDAAGDIGMIESTQSGTNPHGSGVIEPVTLSAFTNASALNGTFVFEFSGADLSGNRVGYAGLLPLDGNGGIAGGLLDTNDNGAGTNGTPLAVTGSYTMTNGVGTLTLNANSQTYIFALYGVSGTKSATTPLTLYAISTTTFDASHPALSGTIVLQDSTQTYDNSALKGNTVVNLTGVDGTGSNVSLTLATTDGAGNISGTFDQNDAGAITGPAQSFGTGYKYSAAGCSNCGRYTVNLLGNAAANPPVPMQFILYASGANRGLLLDQSSTSVMTGTMLPQKAEPGGLYTPSMITSTYAATTASSATTSVDPVADNLWLSWVNTGTCTAQCVNGSQYDAAHPAGVTLTGAYTLLGTGDGTVTLTTPLTTPVASYSYVIYATDTSHFEMIDVDKTVTNASVIFAQQ
jgi:hypothetical protein